MNEIKRMGVIYQQLPNGTLTCGPLDQSNKLGGTNESERNRLHNPERLHRIRQFHPDPKVLDFGCGNGILVNFLRNNDIRAFGYDKYTSTIESERPDYVPNDGSLLTKSSYDVVTMIEVIEHMAAPYKELEAVFDCLRPGGILMIETSFTDWMDLETDPYINPSIGHSTIFSHQGLDELMKEKGFEVYGHINRNVRVYQKPDKPFDNKITLITMGQANPKALKRTMESFTGIVDQVVFGDFLIFESDRAMVESYKSEYPLNIVKAPFNWIFEEGFAETLNMLATHARHDWILYMNVSEVIDGEQFIKEQMSDAYNCYSFDHREETHRWFRMYNRREVRWGGLIHEEVVGNLRPCPFNIFRMKDTEKDMDDAFKAKVSNDVKELVYFQQYIRLVENPELVANTHPSWVKWAQESYNSFKERLQKKGRRYEAFLTGNLDMYVDDIYNNPEFEQERFRSSDLINFQGDRKLL